MMDSVLVRQAAWPMMARNLANGLFFNISWLAIVLTQSALWAPLIAISHLALHFRLMGKGLSEARLVVLVTLLGVALDQVLFALEVFVIRGQGALPPVWISCLWPVLATTLMHAFSGLQANKLLAIFFGAAGGAGSYIAGTRLTDIDFSSVHWGPIILALLWAVLFPGLLWVAGILARKNKVTKHVGT